MPVTWEDFDYVNKLNKKVAFQQLSHYLFLHHHNISTQDVTQYSEQPGVEIEPIEVSSDEKLASYQAKHFDNRTNWGECRASVETTVKKKLGGVANYDKLGRIDFYMNKDASKKNGTRDEIEKIADDAGIAIHWHYGSEILLELNDPSADACQKNIVRRFFDVPKPVASHTRIPTIEPLVTEVVGRENVLSKIKEGLAVNQCVQLYGFPGIGKSTLAHHVATSEGAILGAAVIDARNLSGTHRGEDVEKQVQ